MSTEKDRQFANTLARGLEVLRCFGVGDALRAAANDPAVGVAVLTGAGEHFCSGGNLPSLQEYQGKPRAAIVERIGVLNELVRSLRQFPK